MEPQMNRTHSHADQQSCNMDEFSSKHESKQNHNRGKVIYIYGSRHHYDWSKDGIYINVEP